jgi:hypothetical protein
MRARPTPHARVERDARAPGTGTAVAEGDSVADADARVADLDEGRAGVPEGVGAKVTRGAAATGATTFASSRPARRTVAPAVASTS